MTGLIVFIVGSIGYLIAKKDWNLISRFIVYLIIIFTFLGSLYTFADRNNSTLNKVGAVEVFSRIDALLGKESDTRADPRRSVEKLADTYKFPDDGIQTIVGNGFPSKHLLATTTSDAGVVGNIHTYGVLGLSLVILSIALPSILLRTSLSIGLCLAYFVIFLKNDLAYSRIVFDFYLIVLATVFFKKEN
ncbi:hypothetical protein CWC11_17480 [Pseudoalteromonas sp. S3178]|nr:hypothetical protein CWC11_17480 [Pseudoalteromonas sp. S3178]